MPFGTSGSWPDSYHDVIKYHYAQYDKAIASGDYQPLLYPWAGIDLLLVTIYLLIPHQNRPWLKKCRFLAFAWVLLCAAFKIRYTLMRGLAPALVNGLINSWMTIWVFAILVCNDAQTDFMRIERTTGVFGSSKRSLFNGSSATKETDDHKTARDDVVNNSTGPKDRHGEFAWQPFPLSPMLERLDWVNDILFNFRGMGWNWRISAVPPPPKAIQTQLHHNSGDIVPKHSFKTHAGQVKQYATRGELLRSNLRTLATGYLALDIIKTAMMHDRYFWGYINHDPPSYLPSLITSSPHMTHAYRMLLSMLGIKFALQCVFALAPLFFSGVLSPSLLGARAEPWMYPETWAPYSVVLDHGIAGWWGNWWHQTFRFAFQEPSRKLFEVLRLDRKSKAAKMLQLLIAFFLSGVVHASGSVTCVGDTQPLQGPMAFFLLQAVAIFVETWLTQLARAAGVGRGLPGWLKRTWTFVYVHVWFYLTAHLLCDDFARGGVWLFEPVPISILRGVGLGPDKHDGWLYWSGQVIRWHAGETWWKSGLTL
ncbi:hypothetical protein COCMIDRAFT_2098 [Bipolaris oryzae ATCC 44560]|uniref:Wax synthase domain-containing protein n=1 Tax=Bipolaris oryzae ATCC 44560 TaxID=930090 RepID=W6ZZ53_COCMI|nr:uncharacterized protein COCMIDRAFT_2098 [Bipolaris oryzae ATCC 44560]EUC49031.1 hypothetical protein COCMIDRAFT_2098 [Bipolaris oryzae ATCC 44560]